MNHAVIYLFPLVLDIVVSLALFVSRHSFAEQGLGADLVAAVSVIYGGVYIVASLIMGKLIVPRLARKQMLVSIGLVSLLLCLLANTGTRWLLLTVFALVPLATSMFFNAYQSFMLTVDTGRAKSLSRTVGHYTFAWSVGFALGPVVSSVVRTRLDWTAAYYAAALLAALTGAAAYVWHPERTDKKDRPLPVGSGARALPLAGWGNLFVALTGWVAIATFWPLRAEALGYTALIKGGVEFVYAFTQALAALAVCAYPGWYHRPGLLALPAGCGAAGLLVFALAGSPAAFILGAFCYGIYTGSAFIYMVYHAMFDPDRAVRRVAVNEVTVGMAFVAGPLAATRILGMTGSVRTALMVIAVLVAAGTVLQIGAARWQAYRQEGT